MDSSSHCAVHHIPSVQEENVNAILGDLGCRHPRYLLPLEEDERIKTMSQVVAQYIAGAIVLIGVFLVLSDPQGSAEIINSFSNLNTGAIGALQGRSVSQASGLASRRGR